MIRGTKCTWIKRFLAEDFKKGDLLKHFIQYRGYNVQHIIKSKLDVTFIQVNSDFYRQVLQYWYELYSTEPDSSSDIVNFPLWDNKFITIGGKPVSLNWKNHGIMTMYDIIDKKCNLLTRDQLIAKFNCNMSQMDYNCLIHAIPNRWIKSIKCKPLTMMKINGEGIKFVVCGRLTDIENLTCKRVYWHFISTIGQSPISEKNGKSIFQLLTHLGKMYILYLSMSVEKLHFNLFSTKF